MGIIELINIDTDEPVLVNVEKIDYLQKRGEYCALSVNVDILPINKSYLELSRLIKQIVAENS